MADLIDRAALLEQLESFRADEKWRKKRTLRERWLRTIGIDIFAEAVKKFSSVDAVEVVRCRDCLYWQKSGLFRGHRVCRYVLDCPVVRREDDFCSRGERKDGDGNG